MAFSLLSSLARTFLPSKGIETVDLAIGFVGQFLPCSRTSPDVENNLFSVITGNETDDKKLNAVISAPRSASSSAKMAVDANILAELPLSQTWSWVDNGVSPTVTQSDEEKDSGNTNKIQKNIPERTAEKHDYSVGPKNDSEFAKMLKLRDGNISLTVIFEQQGLHVINEIIVPCEKVKDFLNVNPKLGEIILDAEGNYSEVPHTARAVITLFRFAFGDSYYIRNVDVARETLGLSIAYQVYSLAKYCCSFLVPKSKRLSLKQFRKVLEYVKIPDPDPTTYLNPGCYVAWTSIPYVSWTSSYTSKVSNIDIPLWPVKKTMNDSFDADITNNVVISPVSSECMIWGAQLKMNTDLQVKDVPLKIIYQVKKGEYSFEEEIEKSLRPSILIEFKKKVIADEFEEVEVSFIVEDIRASLCSRSLDTRF